jgi:hypothetical protein
VVSRLKSGVMELGMRVAGDTANIVCFGVTTADRTDSGRLC